MALDLFQNGKRKYRAEDEKGAFRKASEEAEHDVRTFCGLLHYTRCRISEALTVTADRIDLTEGAVVFEILKKRKRGVFREVPVPKKLLDPLDRIRGAQRGGGTLSLGSPRPH